MINFLTRKTLMMASVFVGLVAFIGLVFVTSVDKNTGGGEKIANEKVLPSTIPDSISAIESIPRPTADASTGNANTVATPTPTPTNLYRALFDPNPETRLFALDSIWQAAPEWFNNAEVLRRLEEMTIEVDLRIAEMAQLLMAQMERLRGADDERKGLMQFNGYAMEATLESEPVREGGMTDLELATASSASESEYFNQLKERALRHADPDIRTQALAEAMTQHDEHAIALLAEATHDQNANNRMLAVDGLAQIVAKGVGDLHQIMAILEQAVADPDPAIAGLAQQALQAQRTQFGQGQQ